MAALYRAGPASGPEYDGRKERHRRGDKVSRTRRPFCNRVCRVLGVTGLVDAPKRATLAVERAASIPRNPAKSPRGGFFVKFRIDYSSRCQINFPEE
jgi:hypothetical protein